MVGHQEKMRAKLKFKNNAALICFIFLSASIYTIFCAVIGEVSSMLLYVSSLTRARINAAGCIAIVPFILSFFALCYFQGRSKVIRHGKEDPLRGHAAGPRVPS